MNDEAVRPFVERPQDAGLFLDFDGTLSDIVPVPADARPVAGAEDLLRDLARHFGLVAIVSGRSAHELAEWLGPDVEIWGAHGAQRARGGRVELAPAVADYAPLMAEVYTEALARVAALDLPGAIVEDKEIMIGLHYRAASDPRRARAALDELAEELSERHGLTRHRGRHVFELRPPVDLTKAAIVWRRVEEARLSAAAFAGDDRVDLPGFDALDELAAKGLATLRIAVASNEAPPELLERADVVVESPAGALRFLRSLLPD